MAEEYKALMEHIREPDEKLATWHRSQEVRCRLSGIPGIGPLGAALLLMKAPYPHLFRSGRDFAAWISVADGPAQRIGSRTAQHMPGEEAWLIGEHRSTGERKYYLSNLSADTSLRLLAAAIKARWVCEQAHQQLKEELGLDHFEGRSWTGLHRHALMSMMAYAFLQSRRLTAVGRKERVTGPPPQPSLPAIR